MTTKPNFLIFMTDQQHAGTVDPGHRLKAVTPRLDGFRTQSVHLARTYCPSPHCCPSRASFFTGVYPSQHGVWNNVDVPNATGRGLFPSVTPWSRDLKDAGYRLAFSGKWHVDADRPPEDFGWEGVHPQPRPASRERGREEAFRAAQTRQAAAIADWPRGPRDLAAEPRGDGEILRPGYPPYVHYGTQENPFGDDDTTEAGRAALADLSGGDDPWCLYVGTLGPHDPYTPPQRFLDLYDADNLPPLPDNFTDTMDDKPGLYRRTRGRFDQLTEREQRETIRHYLAFCSYEDWLFGRLLDGLDASGAADNTYVLYLSDHGDYVAEHGLWCKGLPAFDGAYHVPALVRGPGVAAGRRVEAMVSLTDFGPTFVDAAGVTPTQVMTGRSLLPWLAGDTPDDWRDAVFFQTNGNEVYGIQRGVMTDDWKLVFNSFDFDELYDLRADPGQTVNLSGRPEHEAVRRGLYARLWRLMLDHGDDYLNPYIMTGLADYGPATGLEPAAP